MKETFRKSMGWFHNWVGLVLGWILFFIFLTGTIGYFDTEMDRWMQPELPMKYEKFSDEQLATMAVKHLNKLDPNASRWQIYLPNQREDVLVVKWNKASKKGSVPFRAGHGRGGKTFEKFIDPNKDKIIDVRETGGGQLLYKMHYNLHYVSHTTGRIIVGIATMAMLIALITGIIVHINIFKDFFSFKQDNGVKGWHDSHIVTGVVILPFHLMITYSGLVFFIFFYVSLVPLANYGKDMRMMINESFPSQKAVRTANIPAPLINIAPIVTDAKKDFEYIKKITIVNPNDKNMEVLVTREYTTLLRGNVVDKLYYDGNSAKRIEKPKLEKPSGSTFRSIMTGLHTGQYANTFFRWIYFALGVMGTFMIATGLVLWTKKREHRQQDTLGFKFVDKMNAGTIVGLCSAIGAYLIANRVVPADMVGRVAYEINTFFIVWLITFIIAFSSTRKCLWKRQFYIAALIFLSIPIINFIYTDRDIITLISHGDITLIVFELIVIFCGVLFGYLGYKKGKSK